jgi:hypothetical protein
MLRLNNLLDGLSNYLDDLKLAKERLEDKLRGLQTELDRQENYGDRIIALKQKLEQIDRKLGVKQNV